MKVGIINASLPMELRKGLRTAKEIGAHGVQLWVANNELDPKVLGATGRRDLMDFMNHIGLERSALCGDIGGFADQAAVDERIAHTNQPKEVPLGQGDVNFPEYLAVLRAAGYDGYLTIERECGDDPLADVVEAVKFLKAQPGVEG